MIICAAILRDDVIVRGHRHNNCIYTAVTDLKWPKATEAPYYSRYFGFVNSEGKFLNRAEAFEEAYKCGQISEERYNQPDKDLYSEDIY